MRGTFTSVCVAVSAGAAMLGCGSATGANAADLCATGQGVVVCAGKPEYRPAEMVETTVRNTTSETLYVDGCSLKAVGTTNRDSPFETAYLPTARCGADVDLDEILANMVEVPPGATARLEAPLSVFAFQGFYRINVWILDVSGERVSELPAFSGTFLVYPSAGS